MIPGIFPGPDALDPRVLLLADHGGDAGPARPRCGSWVLKVQMKANISTSNMDNDHGFEFVDPRQNHAWNRRGLPAAHGIHPQTPGVRWMSIDAA